MSQFGIRKVLSRNSIVPVVTFDELSKVEPMVEKLLAANISCIEVTLRTPIAFDAIALLKQKYGEALDVGVGTVINAKQLQRAKELAVDFIVSPGLLTHLSNELEEAQIPFIPGVMTPTEVIQGINLGYDTFKLFPAEIAGGVPLLKAFGALFPSLLFCPTGGINEANHEAYLALENVVCVGGSWVVK